MKLTVLIDNNTIIDRYFIGEPGLSYLIEVDGKKVLFDTGYSNAFITNAYKMNISLADIDYLVLSHSHLDHTWGVEPLVKLFTEEILEGRPIKKPKFVAHPSIFYSKTFTGQEEFGINVDQSKLSYYFNMELHQEPYWLTDKLVFLGGIPRVNCFENNSIGKVLTEDGYKEDFNLDDSALCYKKDDGIIIITGCSHSGICNIIEYAKKICKTNKIIDIIGGFHLQNANKSLLTQTVNYLKEQDILQLHPCHCTDLFAKIAIAKVAKINEVGVGLVIEY